MSELDSNQNEGKITDEQVRIRASQILKAIAPKKEQLGLISKKNSSLINFLKKTIALESTKQTENVIDEEKQDLANEHLKSTIVLKIHGRKHEPMKLKK